MKFSKPDLNTANQCPQASKLFFAQRPCLVEIAQIFISQLFSKNLALNSTSFICKGIQWKLSISGSERITLKFKIALRFISSWLKAENSLSRYRLQCSTLFSENMRSFFYVGQTVCKIQNTKSIFILNFVNRGLIKPKW